MNSITLVLKLSLAAVLSALIVIDSEWEFNVKTIQVLVFAYFTYIIKVGIKNIRGI